MTHQDPIALPTATDAASLLVQASTQWQTGDWHSLAKLQRDSLPNHPDRAQLALLAAAGRLQMGKDAEAKPFIRLAQEWGANKQHIAQMLITGVRRSLDRAAELGNQKQRAQRHFESAAAIGTGWSIDKQVIAPPSPRLPKKNQFPGNLSKFYGNEKIIAPNLLYIGGVDGRGLDVLIEKSARFVKIVLNRKGVLNLERVSVFGFRVGEDNLSAVRDLALNGIPTQSSILNNDKGKYGPQIAINNIVNGYNWFSTKNEENPWWKIDLLELSIIKNIQIDNLIFAGPHQADSLQIFLSKNDEDWELVYDRSSPDVISTIFSEFIQKLDIKFHIKENFFEQRDKINKIRDELNILKKREASINRERINILSNEILDVVEALLPNTFEVNKEIIFQETWFEKIEVLEVSNQWGTVPVELGFLSGEKTIVFFDKNKNKVNNLEALKYIKIIPSSPVWHSNTLRVCCYLDKDRKIDLVERDYFSKNLTDIVFCAYQLLDWNNISARCVALMAIPKLMLRSPSGLIESYAWFRASMHHKSFDYRKTALSYIEKYTKYDHQSSRLAFCRHSFATPLLFKDKKIYTAQILKIFDWFAENKYRAIVLYGTLLGAVRTGEMIPYDDDVDIGFICNSDFETEKNKLIEKLASAGFVIDDNRVFNVHHTFSIIMKGEDGNDYPIEIFPVQFVGSGFLMYMKQMKIENVPFEIIGDSSSSVNLHGYPIPAPRKPIDFLTMRYGNDWSEPNPFFEI